MIPMLPAFVGAPEVNRVYNVSAMELLKALPSNSVDCCVTSPPYFGLRDYGVPGQIGLEATPAEYVQTLVTLFRELRRVLKDSGTFWLNLGDSYATSQKGSGRLKSFQGTNNKGSIFDVRKFDAGIPEKNLMLIPHRVAIALQDDGWIVRQDNVWHKPNPMPESVTDRTTRAHEYVFQFAKSGRYYYNAEAIREPNTPDMQFRAAAGHTRGGQIDGRDMSRNDRKHLTEGREIESNGRNKRSVWTITPAQFREAHFATFPTEIPEICIKAGCPPGGLVMDMFMGSGTTADVARRLGMDYIGAELSFEYVSEIIRPRLEALFTPLLAGLAS